MVSCEVTAHAWLLSHAVLSPNIALALEARLLLRRIPWKAHNHKTDDPSLIVSTFPPILANLLAGSIETS